MQQSCAIDVIQHGFAHHRSAVVQPWRGARDRMAAPAA
jgi:hypothetical protein